MIKRLDTKCFTFSHIKESSDGRKQSLEDEENSKNTNAIAYHPEHKSSHQYLRF